MEIVFLTHEPRLSLGKSRLCHSVQSPAHQQVTFWGYTQSIAETIPERASSRASKVTTTVSYILVMFQAVSSHAESHLVCGTIAVGRKEGIVGVTNGIMARLSDHPGGWQPCFENTQAVGGGTDLEVSWGPLTSVSTSLPSGEQGLLKADAVFQVKLQVAARMKFLTADTERIDCYCSFQPLSFELIYLFYPQTGNLVLKLKTWVF